MFDPWEKSVAELAAALESGTTTAVGLVRTYNERIEAFDGTLHAVLAKNPYAEAQARQADAERARGLVHGPLHGVPILIKDNFDTRFMPTTASSIALAGCTPTRDAVIVARLVMAGAIILAKTNLHEFAAGIETTSSLGGQTANPYAPDRYPGGSSGGTGAGVAATFAAFGYGTDTCGSIRIPAAYNALYGLRPTRGSVDMTGVVPLSHTQDVAGPLARTFSDLAVGLDAMFDEPARFAQARHAHGIGGRRIGVLRALFDGEGAEDDVLAIVDHGIARLERLGARIADTSIDGLSDALEGSGLIDHEFKFDLADYLAGVPGAPVRSLDEILEKNLYHPVMEAKFERRALPASRTTEAAAEARAKQAAVRRLVLERMEADRLDAIAYPVMRGRPARIGETQAGTTCQLASSAGTPAIALPAGFTDDGLPVGVELMGLPDSDAMLVACAFDWERHGPARRPPARTPSLA